jgi:DNA-binding CsgD family transcriptional regulator
VAHLTGRGPELRHIAAAMGNAQQGKPAAVAIEGEPGIGKSRLLDEARSLAAAQDWLTLECRCGPFDEDRPFTPLLAGLEDLAAEHESTLPVELVDAIGLLRKAAATNVSDPHSPPHELHGHRLATIIVEGLHELARDHPLLVLFDDCHWIDDASAHVMWGLVRRRRLSRLLVLGTFRRLEASPKAGTTERLRQSMISQGVSWLTLAPLNPGDARTLAEAVLGTTLSDSALRLLPDAAGNPLFISEMFRSGATNTNLDSSDSVDSSVPESLRRIVLSRFDELPPQTTEVLRTAAVSGSNFDLSELSHVHHRCEEDVFASIGAALAHGLVIERGAELVFQHAIVQGIIANSEPLVARQQRHLAIARALADTECRPERIAEHFWRANVIGDQQAVESMITAAHTVRPLSLTAALTWLERAASRCSKQTVSVDLQLEIASLLILLGRFSEAEQLCAQLATEPIELEARIRLRFTLASLATMAGTARNEEAREHISWILERIDETNPVRVELLGWRAMLLVLNGEVQEAEIVASEALCIPFDDESADLRSRAFEARSFVRLFAGDLEAARCDAVSATSLFASDQRAFTSLMMPHFTRAMTTLVNEPVSAVRSILEEGFEVCDQAGHDLARLHLEPLMAITHFVDGGFGASRRVLDAVFSRNNDWRSEGIMLPTATGLSGLLSLIDGDEASALRLTDQALEELRLGGSQAGSADFAVWCVAVVREARGDAPLSQLLLETVWELFAKHASLLTTAPDLVRLSLATKPELASDVTNVARRRADRSGGRLDRASAAACEGYLQREPPLLDTAVELYESMGWSFPALRVRWFAAELDASAARWSDLAVRVPLFESPWLVSRLRAEQPQGFVAPPATAPTLSRAERTVVELVSEGMTNREIAGRLFISHRTVDSHVSHALTKLQLTSRVQLAVWFADQQTPVGLSAPFESVLGS